MKMWITLKNKKRLCQAKRKHWQAWQMVFCQVCFNDISMYFENDLKALAKSFFKALAAWQAFIKKGQSNMMFL